jgi:hypothetical protein
MPPRAPLLADDWGNSSSQIIEVGVRTAHRKAVCPAKRRVFCKPAGTFGLCPREKTVLEGVPAASCDRPYFEAIASAILLPPFAKRPGRTRLTPHPGSIPELNLREGLAAHSEAVTDEGPTGPQYESRAQIESKLLGDVAE